MLQKLEDIELRSEEVQEILTKVPHWMIRWGNVLFLSLIVLILLVSWFVKYPDIIPSEAVITMRIPPEKEYAKTSGKLEAVLVKDKQEVKADQPLAIIENTANYRDVYTLKSMTDTLKINDKSFSLQVDRLPVLSLGDIEPQYARFENSCIQYALNAELQPFSNESRANSYAIAELNRQLQSLLSQRNIDKTELKLKQRELDRSKTLFKEGVISAQEYEDKQLEFAGVKHSYKDLESAISRMRESISEAHKTAKETEINRVKREVTLLKSAIQSLNHLKKAVGDWEYRYVLKSRIKGKVSFLNYWNSNQTVDRGDLVFTIIPSGNPSFVAKLKTPIQNSGKIKVGQSVHIKLKNYPDTEFGVLKGEVKNISLIPDKEGWYLIDVGLPQKLITSYNKEIDFKPEMRGTAEIITADIRLIQRFFYRFKGVLKR